MNIVEKHNIFELIGQRQFVYHSAILTCYTFDPVFFETYFMPKLRSCGISNVIVMMDAGNYDRLMVEYPSYNLDNSNHIYTLVRQKACSNGVFHPKIIMLIGQDAGLLFVGSGNLTYSGFGLNEEIWGVFSLSGTESVYSPLFSGAWNYLTSISQSRSLLIAQQFQWMKDNSSWLNLVSGIETNKSVNVENEQFDFICNYEHNIFKQILEKVGDAKVNRVRVLSPFYDLNGSMIADIYQQYRPEKIDCIISKDGTYPYDLIINSPEWLSFYLWDDVYNSNDGKKKLHGKLIQIDSDNGTFLIIGSANATSNALNGINDEACIFIHNRNIHDYFNELGIDINESKSMDTKERNSMEKPEMMYRNKISTPFHIYSCEKIDNHLVINTDTPDGEYVVYGLSIDGNICSEIKLISKNGQLIDSENKWDRIAIIVLINSNGIEITNRSFVVFDEVIGRCNPNQNLRKLDALLAGPKDWKSNLMDILSYIYFDNDPNEKITRSQGYRIENRKRKSDEITIVKEDFDNIAMGSKQNILSLPNVRIVDFILSSLNTTRHRKDSLHEISDDLDGISNIDNGNNNYQYEVTDFNDESTDFENCVETYSKRLGKYYFSRLTPFYNANKETKNKFILQTIDEEEVRVNDYSQILLNLILMWKLILENQASKHEELIKPFRQNLGRFLLLSRKGYKKRDDYAWYKLEEYHRKVILYAFFIMAHFEWYGKGISKVKVLILNLLDSYREGEQEIINEIWNSFEQETKERISIFNKESLLLIKKTIVDYLGFEMHRNDKSLVQSIPYDSDGVIIYKKQFGFMLGYNFNPVRNNNIIVASTYLLYHPGFDEDYPVKGGCKILAI